MLDETIYTFSNFNDETVEVWKGISNFVHILLGLWLLTNVSLRGLELIPLSFLCSIMRHSEHKYAEEGTYNMIYCALSLYSKCVACSTDSFFELNRYNHFHVALFTHYLMVHRFVSMRSIIWSWHKQYLRRFWKILTNKTLLLLLFPNTP